MNSSDVEVYMPRNYGQILQGWTKDEEKTELLNAAFVLFLTVRSVVL